MGERLRSHDGPGERAVGDHRRSCEQLFTVRTLTADVASIDDDVDVLMLVHPKDLSPAHAVRDRPVRPARRTRCSSFVDPQSENDPAGQQPGNPTRRWRHRCSSLGPLFEAWGVEFDPRQVLGDRQLGSDSARCGRTERAAAALAILGFDASRPGREGRRDGDARLVNVDDRGPVQEAERRTHQVRAAAAVERRRRSAAGRAVRVAAGPAVAARWLQADGERYAIAARVTASSKSAYPDGKPAAEPAPVPSAAGGAQAESAERREPVLVADTDCWPTRCGCARRTSSGSGFAMAWANNGDFVANAVDNLAGSSDLISIRGRAELLPPLHRGR